MALSTPSSDPAASRQGLFVTLVAGTLLFFAGFGVGYTWHALSETRQVGPVQVVFPGTPGIEAPSFVIPNILVPIASSSAEGHLRASMRIDGTSAAVSTMESKRSQIIDIVTNELSGKSVADLTDPRFHLKARADILAAVNPLLGTDEQATNVYFPEFIIQK